MITQYENWLDGLIFDYFLYNTTIQNNAIIGKKPFTEKQKFILGMADDFDIPWLNYISFVKN